MGWPRLLCFTDGTTIGALLDRNGLRPSRFTLTKDGRVILSSEAGSLPVEPENVLKKGRLEPGKMFVVDLEAGRVIGDEELKQAICMQQPYGSWLERSEVTLHDLPPVDSKTSGKGQFEDRLHYHGYTKEELERVLFPTFEEGKEAIGSWSRQSARRTQRAAPTPPQYPQKSAQVSNLPIDSIESVRSCH